jgi:ribokinase
MAMHESPQIVVVGSHIPGLFMRVKRPPVAGETVIGWDYQEPMDGGKGSNQAIAAARLGARVSFVGCVGQDRIGEEGERWMVEAGVDTTYLHKSQTAASGVGFILLAEGGVPAMVSSMGANAELSQAQVEDALGRMGDAQVMLTQFEILPSVAMHAVRVAKGVGMLTILNPAPAAEERLDSLDCVDILVPNESEGRLLLGLALDEPIGLDVIASRIHAERGIGVVLVTAGEQGMVGCDKHGTWAVAPPPVQVIDTSGAGDVFCAALAVALMRGKSIRDASGWACAVAALSVTRPGTIPAYPTLSEADEFLARLG